MDLYDIDHKPVNSDFLREMVKKGQKVVITRMVTFTYTLQEKDITEILDEEYSSGISVERLIEGETDSNGIYVNLDYPGETENVDDLIISVEIQ